MNQPWKESSFVVYIFKNGHSDYQSLENDMMARGSFYSRANIGSDRGRPSMISISGMVKVEM